MSKQQMESRTVAAEGSGGSNKAQLTSLCDEDVKGIVSVVDQIGPMRNQTRDGEIKEVGGRPLMVAPRPDPGRGSPPWLPSVSNRPFRPAVNAPD